MKDTNRKIDEEKETEKGNEKKTSELEEEGNEVRETVQKSKDMELQKKRKKTSKKELKTSEKNDENDKENEEEQEERTELRKRGRKTSNKELKPTEKKAEKEKEQEKEQKEQREWATRLSPARVKKFFDTLSDDQKRDIVGFGGLLHLKIERIPKDLTMWLIEQFNPYTSCLEFGSQSMHISEEDVYLTFGLPKGPKEVQEAAKMDLDEVYRGTLNGWLSEYPENFSLSVDKIVSRMEEQKMGGESFKRNFVIFIVSKMLKGKQNFTANERILKSLKNVGEIKDFNWCRYTWKSLLTTTMEWKTKRKGFKGPILVLMMSYFDRVVHSFRIVDREFPILACWTKQNLAKRLKAERQAGGFGKGRMEDRMAVQNENKEENANESDELKKKKVCVERVAAAAKTFANAYSNFIEAMAEARQNFTNSDSLEKLDKLAQGLMNLYPEKKQQRQQQTQSSQRSSQEGFNFSQEDEIFANPAFWEAIDELENTYKKNSADYVRPSFDVGISDDEGNFRVDDRRPPSISPPNEQRTEIGTHGGAQTQKQGEKEHGERCTQTENEGSENEEEEEQRQNEEEVQEKEGQDQKGKKKVETESQNQQRIQPKRGKTPGIVFKSPFVQRITDTSKPLTTNEKMLVQWAFLEAGVNKSQILYKNEEYDIKREEIRSLNINESKSRGNRVKCVILDVWSFILNTKERLKDENSPLRFFFQVQPQNDLNQMLDAKKFQEKRIEYVKNLKLDIEYAEWINVQKISLMFLSIVGKARYYMICINFLNSTIEIIDPLHTKDSSELHQKTAPILVNLVSTMLQKKRRDANRIKKFKIQDMHFAWKKQDHNMIYESGIFTMRHMETYFGDVDNWSPGFKKTNEALLTRLREKYCFAILNSNTNENKNEIIAQAKELGNRK